MISVECRCCVLFCAFQGIEKKQMGAWDKCEATVEPPEEEEEEGDLPMHKNKYALSLATVIGIVLILWTLRPSFVCESGKGTQKGQLMAGRVLILAFIGGAVVLSAPLLKTLFRLLQSMINR